MKKCLTKTLLIMLFVTLAAVAWGQSLYYEDLFDANNGWTLVPNWSVTAGNLQLSWSPGTLNYDMATLSPDIAVPANAGDLVINQYIDEYAGQGAPVETYEIAVMVGNTATVLWTYALDVDWGVTGGTPVTLSLAPFSGQTIKLRFRGFGGDTFNFDYWHIYDVKAYASLANDLAAISLTGNLTPSQGSVSNYVLNIRNSGSVAVTAADYTVKLFKQGDVEIVSVPGVALAPAATYDFTLPWTPAATGPTFIYGKIVYAADVYPANNQTANLNVVVQASGTVAVTIGDGALTNRVPIDFYWKNSLYECVYLPTDINMGGLITSIAFYNNFVSTTLTSKPTKLWLGETTQTDMSAGWIPSSQLTAVFDGNVAYPAGQNTITIPLTTPYAYGGGTLVLLAQRPMDTEYFSSSDYFKTQTVGTTRARYVYSDTVPYDPAAPPAAAATQLTGSFPKTTLFFITDDMGALSGTVTSGGTPLAGATVSVGGTTLTQVTGDNGAYSFPYVAMGLHQVTCSKVGYNTQTLPATVLENQTVTLNFAMVQLPIVTVTGHVVGSAAPTVGLAGAVINLTGMAPYTATTNANGDFTITGVYASQTYNYVVTMAGYTDATGTAVVGTTNLNMGTITLPEISLPATGVQAVLAAPNVNVTWMAPGTGGGEWIRWDSDLNNDSIGTGAAADFDIASRWPVADLTDYVGQSLYAVKFYPNEVACTYSVRVWTGGSIAAPGTMVVDQLVTAPVIADFNTVTLTTPVPIAAGQELWFGVRCNATAGYPGGCDAGPAHDGLGNMMYFQGAWTTLLALAPTLNYDWNLSGYVGYSAPTRFAQMQPLPFNFDRVNTGTLAASGIKNRSQNTAITTNPDSRPLVGYKVWRLLVGQETNEAAWTLLTPNSISALAFQDTGWGALPDGLYKWAVKAVYTNNVLAIPAISNQIEKLTQVGTIAGIVRNESNVVISGATIATGNITATSNATGAYTMTVPQGTHIVTCSAPTYMTETATGVIVVTGQTTNLNFELEAANEVTDGFETYDDFAIDFPPWTNVDVDASATYGFTGYTWANGFLAQSFMVFNPAATTPASTAVIGAPHTGNKMAMCWAATTPPNNDWLITPSIATGGHISFWAKSMSADYPAEKFAIGISTTGAAPADFTIISGAAPITTTLDWTLYQYTFINYVGQNVKVGIHCTSNDQFALQIDDVTWDLSTAVVDPTPIAVVTALNGNYPNPFNPETTISYSVKGTQPIVVEIYNTKGQKVKTLVNEAKATGNYNVKWNGTDENNQKVSSGVYFFKMNAGKYSSSKKMILMK